MGKTDKQIGELRSHLGFWLRLVSNHVSHAFERKLADSGVSVAEWVILRELYGRESGSPGSLADQNGLTRSSVSRLVDGLVKRRLVRRVDRPAEDRRFRQIALTETGKSLTPRLAALADQNDEEFFASLPAGARATLRMMLRKLALAHGFTQVPTD